jgi:hypothetical protein
MMSSQGSARTSMPLTLICGSRALMRTPAASSCWIMASESLTGARVRKREMSSLRCGLRQGSLTLPSISTPSMTVTSETLPVRSWARNSE